MMERSPVASVKHRWSISHNYLSGVTAGMWWRLLRENRFAVDPCYWHRAAFITLASVVNAAYGVLENRNFGEQVRRVRISEPPLFILGHWRSGTTLLHYLLSRDDEQFAFANTYQVVNPLTFLTTEEKNSRRFAAMVPDRRPMDNMALSFATPQEDEFAPLLMAGCSPYLGISFPRREQDYLRYLSLKDVSPGERDRWKAAFLTFCRKLTLKNPRALLLKSPPHTARIRTLLELFPDARFVHVHRHPCRVFQSVRHYFDTAMWFTYLQRPDPNAIDEGIFQRCNALYDAYNEDRSLIAPERFCEIRFSALEADPVGTTRGIYERLDLGGWERFAPKLQAYVDSLRGYAKNEFGPLGQADRQRVVKAWRRNFEAWGYSTAAGSEEEA